MISFLQRNDVTGVNGRSSYGCYSRLTIHSGDHNSLSGRTKVNKLIMCNGEPIPKPRVFNTSVLIFNFTGFSNQFKFKVLFSFHHMSAVPEKTASGTWNCSAENWPRFKQHIGICDTVDECYGEEDESSCYHVYEGCGRGSFAIGGRCYFLVVGDVMISWKEAIAECHRREAYLASLNTPKEWEEVIELVTRITNSTVYFGLRGNGDDFPDLYRSGFRWIDQSFAFYFKLTGVRSHEITSYLNKRGGSMVLEMSRPGFNKSNSFLCEKYWNSQYPNSSYNTIEKIRLQDTSLPRSHSHITCLAGYNVLKFLACDVKSKCFDSQMNLRRTSCDVYLTPLPPYFMCDNDVQSVPYTFVCDHRPDCSDNSDENFCIFPRCRYGAFRCKNQQCLLLRESCDGIKQCLDGSDEKSCPYSSSIYYHQDILVSPRPPSVVSFDGHGYNVKSVNMSESQTKDSKSTMCPDSHFLCPGKWAYCMPVFVRCNGVVDCPEQEDESGCDRYVCPGFYRCRTSVICVHPNQVCDRVFHCPQRDDELLCDLTCPENCTCYGLAFFCAHPFQTTNFPELRFLDGRKSGITPGHLKTNFMLVFLNIAECGLEYLNHVEFHNLKILDLSRNKLKSIQAKEMDIMKTLQILSLAGNPLVWPFTAAHDQGLRFPVLKFLDMSGVSLVTLNFTTFSIFPKLAFLNLSGCRIEHVVGGGFQFLEHLKSLDIKLCPLETFPTDIFEDVQTLKEVWAQNYKLCCPVILPFGFDLINCHAPADEISSCDDLLRSNFYRIFLSAFSVLALLGNLCSFVYRIFVNRAASNSGFGAFVTHLCVSDFLMGVYLAVIGVADRLYLGTYLWNDTAWKQSVACRVAGCLSLVSSEVSAFIICLITLDRFLVLRFPFSHLHFRKQSAHIACGTAWLIGVVLAGIPLLPMTSHWKFYSQTAICIPLPITRINFAGYDYSFSVSIVVNFLLFLFIAMGQAFIYWSIRTNSVGPSESTKTSNNLTVARRLITIAMSDFLCWFPIGLLGLMASNGVPIPGEVNVIVAILLLPVNSAINPFLYTLNIVLESRRQAQERRIFKMLMSTCEARNNARQVSEKLQETRYTEGEAMQLIQNWLTEGLVSERNLKDVVSKHV